MYRFASWDGYSKNIKLFTWNKDGERIIVDREYTPYLYIEDARGKFKSIFNTPLSKKTFKTPWDRSKFIEESKIKRLFENLKPAQQFLIDEYSGLQDSEDFTKNPLKICFFDIETEPLPFNEFPEACEAKAPISLITIHDSISNEYTTFGTKPFTGKLPEELKCLFVYCKTEKDLLENFIQYIEFDHPDILSAWNSNFFDMEYVVNRITKVLGEENLNRLSPIGKFRIGVGKTKDNPPREYKKYFFDGMLVLDYIDVYKKFKIKLLDTYRLDYVGEIEVDQKKLEYEGTIADFQRNDWNKFVLYNIRDVELLVRIDNKTNYFGLVRFIAYMGLTNFEDSLGVVSYSVGALALIARTRGQILYTPKRDVLEGKNEGGYVSVNPGLTRDLFTLDYSSLYPNLIRTLNISIDTLVGEFIELEDGNIHLTLVSGKQYTLPKDKFDALIKAKNFIKTAANIIFSQDIQGIVPEYMETLFNKRKSVRNSLFEKEKLLGNVTASINNKKDALDIKKLEELRDKLAFEIKQHDIVQYVYKIALNSLYGCLTSKISPVGDDRLGNACTLSGQESIKEVNNFVRDFVQKHYYPDISDKNKNELVQFNDTDSCGITLKCLADKGYTICKDGEITDEGFKIITTIADAVNKHIISWSKERFNSDNCSLDLKLEKIVDAGIFRKKKNYALHVVYDEGKIDEKTGKLKQKWVFTGIELAKAIISKPIKDIGKNVIEPMILKQDQFETDKRLREAFQEFKKLPLVTICKLARIKTFNKYVKDCSGFETSKGMQEHIRAAYYYNLILKAENINGFQEIREGDTCQILKVKPNNKYRIDCIAIRDGEFPNKFLEIFEPDYPAIFEKPFYACISSLYKIANWRCPNVTDEYDGNLFDLFD